MGIPRFLRDFQARWKSLLLDFSTERLFHSLRRECFAFSYCSPPIIRIYDLSSVRYLLAMFRFSANHSVLADGIMRSCWRSFCGGHLNYRRTRGMTSQTAFKSTPGHAPARWQSHCARTRHLVIEAAQDGLQTRPGSVVPAGTDGAGGPQ